MCVVLHFWTCFPASRQRHAGAWALILFRLKRRAMSPLDLSSVAANRRPRLFQQRMSVARRKRQFATKF